MTFDQLMAKVLSSETADWKRISEKGIIILSTDLSISIQAEPQKEGQERITSTFETWALNHPDPTAHLQVYYITFSNTPIYQIITATVDGGRATIPWPEKDNNEWVISKSHHKLGEIISCNNTKRYNEYIERCKIIVK